ncbi:HNH endonuclease signature motif containing protein [Aspergillus foveolatus]|uniref:HNH endonuclease signature motif containing protein n=1 Tax=Aspergillus foveolatus TaxID=210207 RepID=UPI003CCD8788
MAYLEVAHIIPHFLMSLTGIEGDLKPDGQKQVAHKILKMFNPSTVQLINGTDINRPMNALTLTHDLHRLFGNFEVAFKPFQDQLHTYKIDFGDMNRIFRGHNLPVTRTLYINRDLK